MKIDRKKAIQETGFLTFFNNGVFGIRYITQLILARLLTPEIFGVVVMAATVLEFLNLLGRWGIDAAAVQKRKDLRFDDSIFTLTVLIADC